jgi:hypothetical protein
MMHATRTNKAPASATTRSKINNQPARLAGIDGRSSDARRRRDLIMTYADALGGADKVSAATVNDIVRAVDLVIIAEQARAKALRGDKGVDLGDLTRLEGAADRAVRRLGIKQDAGASRVVPMRERLRGGAA